ncbi:MAG: FKBP-type peptidyl-prolyl cis-trans isomerase, partial [archaeon]|nr:FKBP-type peptidyl-prolyl cis-trans isomerase [archaeon]
MKEGSIVAVNYTGKIIASGEVFDTTVEKKAVDAGVFSPKAQYVPVIAIIGEGELLKGLDNTLKEIKVGEEKIVKLLPADAYGERNPK